MISTASSTVTTGNNAAPSSSYSASSSSPSSFRRRGSSSSGVSGGGFGDDAAYIERSYLPHSSLVPNVQCAVRTLIRPKKAIVNNKRRGEEVLGKNDNDNNNDDDYDEFSYLYDLAYCGGGSDGAGDDTKDMGGGGEEKRNEWNGGDEDDDDEELRVTANLYGMGGLPMHVSASCASTRFSSMEAQRLLEDEEEEEEEEYDEGGIEKKKQEEEEGGGSTFVESSNIMSTTRRRRMNTRERRRRRRNGRRGKVELKWNEILDLPVRWKDLPRDACIVFDVIGSGGELIWSTTLSLFDKNGLMRNGIMKLELYPRNKNQTISASGADDNGIICGGKLLCSTTPGLAYSMPSKMNFTSKNYIDRKDFWMPYHMSGVHATKERSRRRRITQQEEHVEEQEEEDLEEEKGYGLIHEAVDCEWKAFLILDKLENCSSNNNAKQSSLFEGEGEGAGAAASKDGGTFSGQRSKGGRGRGGGYWLDEITKKRCEEILQVEEEEEEAGRRRGDHRGDNNNSVTKMRMDSAGRTTEEKESSSYSFFGDGNNNNNLLYLPPKNGPEAKIAKTCYLIVELPIFPLPIIHEDTFYPPSIHGASGSVTALDMSLYRHHKKQQRYKEKKSSKAIGSLEQKSTDGGEDYEYDSNKEENDEEKKDDDNDNKDMGLSLITFLDYENEEHENPVEDKYRTLAHDLLRGLVDPTLKPDRYQRSRIQAIIQSPSHHLTREEKDLLWRFRFSLVDNRKALTKFLLAVDWMEESEVVQAAELLEQWRKRSPIAVTDALKLLGRHVAFQTSLVRRYAIDTLALAPDDELQLYLLQLVQALKYEDDDHDDSGYGGEQLNTVAEEEVPVPSMPFSYLPSVASGGGFEGTKTGNSNDDNISKKKVSSLASFLIDRSSKNLELANFLYWYLKVEMHDGNHGERYRTVFSALKEKLKRVPAFPSSSSQQQQQDDDMGESLLLGGGSSSKQQQQHHHAPFSSIFGSVTTKLGSSLRSVSSASSDDSSSNHHQSTSDHTSSSSSSMWDILLLQDDFISNLLNCQMESRDVKGKKDSKELHLQNTLSSRGFQNVIRHGHRRTGGNSSTAVIPLPSEPHILVTGINPLASKMFKSALYPALIEFRVFQTKIMKQQQHNKKPISETTTTEGQIDMFDDNDDDDDESETAIRSTGTANIVNSTYKVIVKTGDDLRQDQLVMMMIKLMDGLLKQGTLDLCLTPYSIIATSPTSGLVEYVSKSKSISQILATHNNSILQYLQTVAYSKTCKYNVKQNVMQTYVRSCAGYCVITYLLGVGDRHLDNIMLKGESGHFFHIDFGYIFGRDPKPLPPPFRLTREMVEAMGGMESSEYLRFCSLACQAYNLLRKNAGLVLNLLELMSDGGIEDLSNNPNCDVEGVIAKVSERFRLELTDEQADSYFLRLIGDSLAAFAPRVMEVFHQLAVARR